MNSRWSVHFNVHDMCVWVVKKGSTPPKKFNQDISPMQITREESGTKKALIMPRNRLAANNQPVFI